MKRCISAAIEESAKLFCPSCQNLFQRKTVASGSGFALTVAFIRNHVLANDPTFASGFGESSGGKTFWISKQSMSRESCPASLQEPPGSEERKCAGVARACLRYRAPHCASSRQRDSGQQGGKGFFSRVPALPWNTIAGHHNPVSAGLLGSAIQFRPISTAIEPVFRYFTFWNFFPADAVRNPPNAGRRIVESQGSLPLLRTNLQTSAG